MSPNVLPFPVHIVTGGDIRADVIAKVNTTGQRFASIPWFLRSPNGKDGMGRRQCTKEYKLRPIQRKIVELHGGGRPKGGTEVWVGISTDEALLQSYALDAAPRPATPCRTGTGAEVMKGHQLLNRTLSRDAPGVTAKCECGWSSGGHVGALAASAAHSDHQEQELASLLAEQGEDP